MLPCTALAQNNGRLAFYRISGMAATYGSRASTPFSSVDNFGSLKTSAGDNEVAGVHNVDDGLIVCCLW
jgi:hypothetical protein